MTLEKLIIKSRRVVTPKGCRPASVVVQGGRIEALASYDKPPAAASIFDAGEKVVMAGLVDSHVHINDPGRAEWEGFETATRAAAAGGITTVVDMPLNSSPVTTSVAALKAKLAAAERRCSVDCGFWGGLVPGNAQELEPLIDAGVCGFKAFLVDSGIDEFPAAGERDLRLALPILARRGLPLLAHAELACTHPPQGEDRRHYSSYLNSRPKIWENEAIKLLARLCQETGARVHIVHLSSAEALETVAQAKRAGAPLTVETCPHYLSFCSEEIEDGRTEFKCSPPIREKANRERLWEGLKAGLIDMIVSDHSPCSPELKRRESGDFSRAWGGVASLQLALPAVWTEAKKRGFKLEDLALWMCEKPALLAGLNNKGRLEPGCEADLVVWDPEAVFTVEPSMIRHRHSLTPYLGKKLNGAVEATFLRGRRIFGNGVLEPNAHGSPLLKKAHELHRTY